MNELSDVPAVEAEPEQATEQPEGLEGNVREDEWTKASRKADEKPLDLTAAIAEQQKVVPKTEKGYRIPDALKDDEFFDSRLADRFTKFSAEQGFSIGQFVGLLNLSEAEGVDAEKGLEEFFTRVADKIKPLNLSAVQISALKDMVSKLYAEHNLRLDEIQENSQKVRGHKGSRTRAMLLERIFCSDAYRNSGHKLHSKAVKNYKLLCEGRKPEE